MVTLTSIRDQYTEVQTTSLIRLSWYWHNFFHSGPPIINAQTRRLNNKINPNKRFPFFLNENIVVTSRVYFIRFRLVMRGSFYHSIWYDGANHVIYVSTAHKHRLCVRTRYRKRKDDALWVRESDILPEVKHLGFLRDHFIPVYNHRWFGLCQKAH